MAGITNYGFVRKTLQEILASMKQGVKSKLGDDWNVDTGSVEDQFLSVFAEEADQCWQGLEGTYSSQTLDGAEGIYLDDMLSSLGIYRKGRTASSGTAVLLSNYATINFGTTVPTTTTVSSSNGLTYKFQEDVVLDNYCSAYTLPVTALSVGTTYEFKFYNVNSPTTQTFSWTVVTDSNKDEMLRNLVVFINDVVLDKPTNAYFNSANRTMYVGFNQATNLPQPFNKGQLYISSTPRVGNLGHRVFVKTDTLGFNPLSPNGLLNVSPTYTGYTSVMNGDDFNAGSEVQTDAEYRLSYININDTSIAGTVDSVIAGLLRVEGVVDADVYENPTPNFVYDISGNLVNNPYTYNVAVLGGDDNDVAQVILDKSPANTQRYGTYSAVATNFKGQSVSVNFTRVGYFDVEVEVGYKSKDNTPLTEVEKNNIASNIAQAVSELRIGDSVPKNLLEAVTFQSVGFARLSRAEARLKDLTVVSGQFTTDDLQSDYDEKPRVLLDKVIFKRL
jgi:uncharacterized phage protein gp47/JayE